MYRKELLPGVTLTQLDAPAFKRCRISLNFMLPGDRSSATACALLPMVMERGYADCPDMTRLARRLARLYGAGLSVYGGMLGPNRVITISISGIRNEYAVGGEDLLAEYLELLFGMAFKPNVTDGAFDAEAVEIEKDKLFELQQSEINDKRLYCLRQARRKFYGDTVGGLEKYGYAEDLDDLTPQALYNAWRTMVTTARVEAVVLGTDAQPVETRLLAALQRVDALRTAGAQRPQPLHPPYAMPVQPVAEYAEPVDAVQGKLAMVFTMDEPLPHAQLSKMRLAMALLGGTPTSRLFMNVREKQSLCYYCASGFIQLGGCMHIDSGVEFENTEKAKRAILHEIEELINGEISEKEMEDARRYLCSALESVGDSLSSLENWIMSEISRGTMDTPEQVAQQLAEVTVQDVREMMRKFHLSVVYVLSRGGKCDE